MRKDAHVEQGSSLGRKWNGGMLASTMEDDAVPSKPQDQRLTLEVEIGNGELKEMTLAVRFKYEGEDHEKVVISRR